jgi:transposase
LICLPIIVWLTIEVSACRGLAVEWLTRGTCASFEAGVPPRFQPMREEDREMDVMIGVDPHKGSHTATMLDRGQRELRQITVRAGRRQVAELLAWADGVGPRTWAVECAGGMGYLLSQQLVAAGETVLDVPATLASRVRVLGTGQSMKTDPNDARSVALAALHAPALAVVRRADHVTVCRLLAKRHTDVARWRTKLCCRLHALVAELVPGGIDKEVVVKQARRLLDEVRLDDVAMVERHRQALELVTEIEHLDAVVKDSRVRITAAVAASCTTLTEIFGVGPIVAAMLIGYTGDPTRFATASRYAAYTGTAPIEFSSGGRTTHRLSRRGNRRLNHALHCAAITQIRHRHSPGRGYYERKLAEGHTPREAIRALKRRLSDVAWRHLVADAQRAAEA